MIFIKSHSQIQDPTWYNFTIDVDPTELQGRFGGRDQGTNPYTISGYSIGELYSCPCISCDSSSKTIYRGLNLTSGSSYDGYVYNTSDVQSAIIDSLVNASLENHENHVHILTTKALNLRFLAYFGSGITSSGVYIHFNIHIDSTQIIKSVDNFSFINVKGGATSTIINSSANRIEGVVTSISPE